MNHISKDTRITGGISLAVTIFLWTTWRVQDTVWEFLGVFIATWLLVGFSYKLGKKSTERKSSHD